MWDDVIVIGGGPAGAMAARELASLGLEVLVLEKRSLPRFKACGGCLSPRVLSTLGFDVGDCLEDATFRATFTFDGREPISIESGRPMGYMVRRERFDQFLCAEASGAGARVLTGQEVKRVEVLRDRVRVFSQDSVYQSRLVIGAEGAASVVRRDLLSDHHPAFFVALEGRLRLPPARVQALRGGVLIDLGVVRCGYAWAFPKKDHVSVGVMAPKRSARGLKTALARFLGRQQSLGGGSLELLRGALLPVYDGNRKRTVGPRALLVGDAASQVDPLLGEGIYYGIQGARKAASWAAKAIENPELLLAYQGEVDSRLEQELRPALFLSKWIYLFPRFCYYVLKRHPAAVELYADILRGSATYRDLRRQIRIHALASLGLGGLFRPRS